MNPQKTDVYYSRSWSNSDNSKLLHEAEEVLRYKPIINKRDRASGKYKLLLMVIVMCASFLYFGFGHVSLDFDYYASQLQMDYVELLMPEHVIVNELSDIYFTDGGGQGGEWYYSYDEKTEIETGGYPDMCDPSVIVSITCKTPEYSFLNIEVGMAFENAKDILYEEGFKLTEKYYSTTDYTYKYGDMLVGIDKYKGKVVLWKIDLLQTNLSNSDF